jgi:hypothetical protein
MRDYSGMVFLTSYNTAFLLFNMPDGSYRLVQLLRAINQVVQSRHLVVPNIYNFPERYHMILNALV